MAHPSGASLCISEMIRGAAFTDNVEIRLVHPYRNKRDRNTAILNQRRVRGRRPRACRAQRQRFTIWRLAWTCRIRLRRRPDTPCGPADDTSGRGILRRNSLHRRHTARPLRGKPGAPALSMVRSSACREGIRAICRSRRRLIHKYRPRRFRLVHRNRKRLLHRSSYWDTHRRRHSLVQQFQQHL